LHVAAPTAPALMTGCISWRYMDRPVQEAVVRNMVKLAGVADYRCAAHQYRMLAAGHCDYLVFNRLMPWDHLPGWLLHQEAGGYSAHFDGSPYRPGDLTGGLICTPDKASFTALCGTLMEEP
jgi:fructose-1,6-bisphosphatase/inositol monophosphatase family enzyme